MKQTTHLLYLHGFRSSPQSAKARQMAALVAERFPRVTWWCPQLPASPREAIKMLMDCGGQVISDTLIGCCFADSRSKALGDKLPSLECSRVQL